MKKYGENDSIRKWSLAFAWLPTLLRFSEVKKWKRNEMFNKNLDLNDGLKI